MEENTEAAFTPEYVRELLQEHKYLIVKFKKVSDGSIRIMRCTIKHELYDEYIKGLEETSSDTYHTSDFIDDDFVSVIDLEKNAWRGFLCKTIISIGAVK